MKKRPEETITVKKPPELPFIKVVSGTGIINNFPKHMHSGLCAGIITDGERIFSVGERNELLHKGDVFIINPGEPHLCSSYSGNPHSYNVIIIDSGFMSGITAEASADVKPLLFENFITGDTALYALISELVDSLVHSRPLIEKESLLYSLVENLIRYHSVQRNDNTGLKGLPLSVIRAKEYIDNNLSEEISMAELSRVSGVTPFHLNRMFCSGVGIAPHTYQIQMRIAKSKELLLDNMPIVEVALETGFTDQSHFSKFFRKHVGTTPGNYLKHNMENIRR